MAALQSHHDSRVNPYRYGVLEGNHTEERFGLDLVHREVSHGVLFVTGNKLARIQVTSLHHEG